MRRTIATPKSGIPSRRNPAVYPPVKTRAATMTSGPMTAPAWSSALWTPNPHPLPTAAVAWERIVSRAGVLMAFPIRSNMMRKAATSQRPAKARSGMATSRP